MALFGLSKFEISPPQCPNGDMLDIVVHQNIKGVRCHCL
jgi:hypothetical protein